MLLRIPQAIPPKFAFCENKSTKFASMTSAFSEYIFSMDAVFTDTLSKLAFVLKNRSLCTVPRLALTAFTWTNEAVVIETFSKEAFLDN